MLIRLVQASYLGAVLGAALIVSSGAQAQDLSSCGDIYVAGEAMCTVIPPSADCSVMCKPVSLEASCAADLYVQCKGQCNVDVDVGCTGSCSASCMAQCDVDPGKLDCSAQCQGQCAADCQAQCGNSSDSHCSASCKASCSGSCNAECDVVPPSADCKAKCDASCQGSCHAKANADCNIKCQSGGYVKCQADLQGGCEAACKTQKGALFCDDQFIDTNSLDQCVDALRDALDIEVQGYAEGSSSCDGGTCEATGSAGASCSAVPGAPRGAAGWLAGVGMLALGTVLRRRRKT